MKTLLALAGVFACVACACAPAPDPGDVATSPEAALARDVRFLCDLSPPRSADYPDAMRAAADYIATELRAAGAGVQRQELDVDGVRYENVSALLGPTGGERIVIGAHYDVAGNGPGADDNASGVAVLLELARRLRSSELHCAIELVAYALEEPPFFGTDDMGSAHHARALVAAKIPVRAMICLEMLGYFSDAPGSQGYPNDALRALYPSVGHFVAIVGLARDHELIDALHASMRGASPLPIEKLAMPIAFGGIDLSDHRNYWSAGFPAVMVTDTAFLRNPHYHAPSDTPDTLDPARMAHVVTALHAAVVDLARE